MFWRRQLQNFAEFQGRIDLDPTSWWKSTNTTLWTQHMRWDISWWGQTLYLWIFFISFIFYIFISLKRYFLYLWKVKLSIQISYWLMLSHSAMLLYFNINSNIIFITFLLVSVPSSHLYHMLDNCSHFTFWYPFLMILKYI